MERKRPIKEVIFNPKEYAVSKRLIIYIFIFFIIYFQFTKNQMASLIAGFVVASTGILYFVCKLCFYRSRKKVKDGLPLLAFLSLFLWLLYLVSTR
ncbi:hypothetical protein [Bacillus sinesaloumensis]|uniref:hypothetical protein n=1 Tax=Litchfieldia sinesaloumensis TaxID=1926280 RepID=UPI00135646A0|nr:hypothetical protein [Bacillus sinesaloumensis]